MRVHWGRSVKRANFTNYDDVVHILNQKRNYRLWHMRMVKHNSRNYFLPSSFDWPLLPTLYWHLFFRLFIYYFFSEQKRLLEVEQEKETKLVKERYSHADDVRKQIRDKEQIKISERNAFLITLKDGWVNQFMDRYELNRRSSIDPRSWHQQYKVKARSSVESTVGGRFGGDAERNESS